MYQQVELIQGVRRPRAAVRSLVRCQPGDIWQLGRHRLLIGDSHEAEAVARLFDGARPDTCLCDPPYGINYNTKHKRFTKPTKLGGGAQKQPDRPPVHGDTGPFNPGPLLSYKHVVLFGAQFYAGILPRGSWLVWDKRHRNGRAMLADAELAWMKGGQGVYIFAHRWQGLVRDNRAQEPNIHPTQKPIALMAWCLAKCKAGEAVYDPYAGSGPVLLACEQTGRTCYAVEIDPRYGDAILLRYERMTGQRAERV